MDITKLVDSLPLMENYGKDIDAWIRDFEEKMDLWDIGNLRRKFALIKQCVSKEIKCILNELKEEKNENEYPNIKEIKDTIEEYLGITPSEKCRNLANTIIQPNETMKEFNYNYKRKYKDINNKMQELITVKDYLNSIKPRSYIFLNVFQKHCKTLDDAFMHSELADKAERILKLDDEQAKNLVCTGCIMNKINNDEIKENKEIMCFRCYEIGHKAINCKYSFYELLLMEKQGILELNKKNNFKPKESKKKQKDHIMKNNTNYKRDIKLRNNVFNEKNIFNYVKNKNSENLVSKGNKISVFKNNDYNYKGRIVNRSFNNSKCKKINNIKEKKNSIGKSKNSDSKKEYTEYYCRNNGNVNKFINRNYNTTNNIEENSIGKLNNNKPIHETIESEYESETQLSSIKSDSQETLYTVEDNINAYNKSANFNELVNNIVNKLKGNFHKGATVKNRKDLNKSNFKDILMTNGNSEVKRLYSENINFYNIYNMKAKSQTIEKNANNIPRYNMNLVKII